MNDRDRELEALRTRAGIAEAARQSAEQRRDWQAVREHELELSRLSSRARDLERQDRVA